jgi:hypothetical protein
MHRSDLEAAIRCTRRPLPAAASGVAVPCETAPEAAA